MKKYCHNCYHPIHYKAKFCAHCGQKVSDGKVPVSDVMQQLWFRILHLESRSWRVLWRLFVPGQVSLDYFQGKRKRYPPPVQFFFVVMFFFLLLLNYVVSDSGGFRLKQAGSGVQFNAGPSSSERPVDLYQLGQRYARTQQLRSTFDSLPSEYRTPVVKAALDTLLQLTDAESGQELQKLFNNEADSLGNNLDSLSFNLGVRQVRVAFTDLFEMDVDAIIQKYQFTDWLDQMLLRQGIKSVKEPKTLVKTYIGSLAWTLLLLVALMSGAFTLLYWRRRRYYVEHFIFLLHQHTSGFLLLTIAMLIHQFCKLPLSMWAILFFWVIVSTAFAMRRYYRQGWLKTFAKWVIFSFAYFVGFAFLFISSILVIFLIF